MIILGAIWQSRFAQDEVLEEPVLNRVRASPRTCHLCQCEAFRPSGGGRPITERRAVRDMSDREISALDRIVVKKWNYKPENPTNREQET
jgi:hypothetical protein